MDFYSERYGQRFWGAYEASFSALWAILGVKDAHNQLSMGATSAVLARVGVDELAELGQARFAEATHKIDVSASILCYPYDPAEVRAPPDYFTDQYLNLSPEGKSRFMRGNIPLAVEGINWWNAMRFGELPSHHNIDSLQALMYDEMQEIVELADGGKNPSQDDPGMSVLEEFLSRPIPNDEEWFSDCRASKRWEVMGEVADVSFLALTHLILYDGMRVEDVVKNVRLVIERFDEYYNQRVATGQIIGDVREMSRDVAHVMSQPVWPEMYLGLCIALSKRMGFDLWEAIILKTFGNERNYPSTLKMVEPGESWQINVNRSPARVFMRNLRQAVSPDTRSIPAMNDPIIGKTVLEKYVYGDESVAENDPTINLLVLANKYSPIVN
ncbi:MAG: hypothetical protein UY18_C0003G0004 [Microgenomates group bacterium GW2011_GWF2_47_9]|nr:MAG: hypothetical protein UY18_C0003G0004 [Microgenomates group bacterium GW2011_GWF2_47_9]